jgi:hypothetical protein
VQEKLQKPLVETKGLIRTLLLTSLKQARSEFEQFEFWEKKCPAKNSRASPLTIRNQDVILFRKYFLGN